MNGARIRHCGGVTEGDARKRGKWSTDLDDENNNGVDWLRWYDEQAEGRLRVDEAEEKRIDREEEGKHALNGYVIVGQPDAS